MATRVRAAHEPRIIIDGYELMVETLNMEQEREVVETAIRGEMRQAFVPGSVETTLEIRAQYEEDDPAWDALINTVESGGTVPITIRQDGHQLDGDFVVEQLIPGDPHPGGASNIVLRAVVTPEGPGFEVQPVYEVTRRAVQSRREAKAEAWRTIVGTYLDDVEQAAKQVNPDWTVDNLQGDCMVRVLAGRIEDGSIERAEPPINFAAMNELARLLDTTDMQVGAWHIDYEGSLPTIELPSFIPRDCLIEYERECLDIDAALTDHDGNLIEPRETVASRFIDEENDDA